MSIQIDEIGLADVSDFARFWVGATGSADEVLAKARKIESLMGRSLNLDPSMPLGWVARTHEQGIVAGKLCFGWSVTNGSATQNVAMSGFLRVHPDFAAMAGLLFKKYLSLSSRYALVATSTNAASARLWKAFKGVPLAGSDTQWIRLGTSTAAKRELLRLRTGRARVSDLLGPFMPPRMLKGLL